MSFGAYPQPFIGIPQTTDFPTATNAIPQTQTLRLRGSVHRAASFVLQTLPPMVYLLSLFLAVSALAQPIRVEVNPAESEVTYRGVHFTHAWSGSSRQLTGEITLDPARPEASRVMLSIPVASFNSGNRSRDANMVDLFRASEHPNVRFTSERIDVVRWSAAASGGMEGQWRATGTLFIAGRSLPHTAVVDVRWHDGQFTARTAFAFSMDAYEIERPRLLFRAMEDAVQMNVQLKASR